MKKPLLKSEIAFSLGKAARSCQSIREIFESLDVSKEEIDKIHKALITIEIEIDKEIDALREQP